MLKNIIVSMRNEGYTLQHIADTLNIHRGTVSDVIVRFKKRGSTENKPRSGRPRILDPRDERSLVIIVDLTNTFNLIFQVHWDKSNQYTYVSKFQRKATRSFFSSHVEALK
jgi:transposase